MEVRNLQYNQFGTVDAEIKHEELGWIPFTAAPESGDEMVETVWQAVKDRIDIAPFEPPESWKADAFDDVRQARDNLLALITDPSETVQGKIAWNAKLISSIMVLVGLDRLKGLFGIDELPASAQGAFGQIISSMTFLAKSKGLTVEQYAFEVIGKFIGFSAFVWLADEKTARAWQAIEALPNSAEGFAMLGELEKQLRAEAEATAKAAQQMAAT